MCNLKKLALLAIGLGLSIEVYAEDWQPARLENSESLDINYSRCYYKANYQNYQFSFIIKGGTINCPTWIEYNPLTGQWRKDPNIFS